MILNRILVLEDDVSLSEIIAEFLTEHGFEVRHCDNGLTALDVAYEENFDLYVLDVMVPQMDGFSLLEKIREAGRDVPAIFITSLSGVADLEKGYASGCDDYVRKPFGLEELLLRIRALLKRKFAHLRGDFEEFGNGVKFEPKTKTLYREDKPLFLPRKELELLSILLQNPNRFVSREEIFSALWNYGEEPSEMSLRVYVKNLRNLIGKEKIITQRNNGYCYVKS